jgi:hypothetical protein
MFVEMPRDNRMAVTFEGATPQPLALPGLLSRLDHRRMQNDLIFRSDWQFCNIEPKICQHG